MFNNLIIKVMKKIFILAAVTAIALTACTKTETTAVSEGNLIKFDNAFVGNVTKADMTKSSLTSFWVYGGYDASSNYVKVFDGTEVNNANGTCTSTATAYWVNGKAYEFAAYSDGNTSLDNVTFTASENKLSISGYEAGKNDLIAATKSVPAVTAATQGPVEFSFKHLLSKVKFTFRTSMADSYTMKVEGLLCL